MAFGEFGGNARPDMARAWTVTMPRQESCPCGRDQSLAQERVTAPNN